MKLSLAVGTAHPMHTRNALLAFTVFAATGCGPRTTNIGEIVDAGPPSTLTATGRVCTTAPDPSGFPVKVVFLVDQSGSSCVSDPPGAQETQSLCEQQSLPPGLTQPARVRALLGVLTRLQSRPNVSVALVPFQTNVRGVWPPPVGTLFGRPDPSLFTRVQSLQVELGGASDFQGALAYALALISADVARVEQTDPVTLPRTAYQVVMLANGPASPRCASNDNLSSYADDLNPTGVWADTESDLCNLLDPLSPDAITGFVAGADRNQNGQLLHAVSRLKALEAEHHVGAVRLDTRLLFNEEVFAACGPACDRLYGFAMRWPGPVPAPSVGAFARASAKSLLQSLATRGGGSFEEAVSTAQLAAFTLDSLDFDSLAAENVRKALVPQVLRGTASGGAWVLDDDGDGLSNDDEASAGTDPGVIDTDGDGFDDQFEATHRAAAFDPLVRDSRGCDPASPLTPACVARDTDGDGLSQYAEAWLQTSSVLPDTDRDGLPDGLEVRWGLDPRVRLAPLSDVDGDGVADLDEVLRGSDPRAADAAFPGISISSVEGALGGDGRRCYDFTVSNLPMLDTPFHSGPIPPGVNLFKLWFAEAPRDVPEDVGTWSAACFFARRDLTQTPPILVPAGLSQSVSTTNFVGLSLMAQGRTDTCSGTEALTP